MTVYAAVVVIFEIFHHISIYLKQLDDYANEMKKKYGGNANMNAEFNRCPT